MGFQDPHKQNEWRRLKMSFSNAITGIIKTFMSERNFRIHCGAAILVIACGFFFRLTLIEWTIILILIGGMLALELMNTAVEHAVDLFIKENHPLAKAAKDAAAGAVCVFAAVSGMIGLLIFLSKLF
ncbi:diacylglycerol kinase family protein [Bacillus haynesii]|uniref:diacylglycerol kinase family protein n=1 Tax=Bacillus haynesii TaxID=1925021 RepID=UPI0022812CAD|nr:diacylglycerol kinase family protein [Bacillus haynesii]MCY7815282.1 diacylglycerol kinase family protein [Bacillus haynesii]MCY8224669.1 diacylglycerol kinase family protein [Bacillus haynesii]MCY8241582.1 diacylglycerol kinase family protein [Bacillus haynesii]MCY8371602.1 diacylglycerol kinase family protein [Bacillus haynesii]MCY8567102.1 diacylglycerol kinase family protein [Bacillus haynesii]